MIDHRNMTHGHPGKLILLFALPLMLGNVFQQMYTVVDTAIVGRGVGMIALAALGTVTGSTGCFLVLPRDLPKVFLCVLPRNLVKGMRKA